jgi:hypothetical protein
MPEFCLFQFLLAQLHRHLKARWEGPSPELEMVKQSRAL